ncbi:MAG: hypothetical protein A3H50_01395 [Candidatus Levybacteria bacterium RIFCSPLOWO2_02_FULL_37_10]|nr:MAG: hypothetical protein A2860_03110 [Candidatus Levybacteria bacterium RIFCSPHIGHO2_01_FULL_37_33]OGH16926.1 MAG: hypothetical protein A3C97_00210 [Candidatus Levybacteria bacterium RIFCSPHIGHO2_02_FULL_37_11]OGH29858.1 MAG: hypothetical protein A3F30_01555 [Candidatus Levybacteria bacterium RIFCSPHIGHO2_12_FULL_37_12]OGH32964.1 MAG: hypothetical protein A2953_00915 [Candidatus Levybacteria bacterium RIFCSPLOWO2_01_FULL_36_54]OGH43326.1 MAG: hypothetical protein A3H50_01395 [Candidatus Lev
MKKWEIIRNILLSISAIVVVSSVVYYLFAYLPSLSEKKELYEQEVELYKRRENCAQAGKEYHLSIIKNPPKYAELPPSYFTPRFYYNHALKKCLYHSGYLIFQAEGTIHEEWVIDINTSEKLAFLSYFNGKDVTVAGTGERLKAGMDKEQFNLKVKELFGDQ